MFDEPKVRKSRYRLTDDDRMNIPEFHKNGATVQEIARLMGATPKQVSDVLKESGETVSMGPRSRLLRMSERELEQFMEDFEGAATMKHLAAKYDISVPTAYHWASKLGLTPRSQGATVLRAREMQLEEAIRLYQAGWITRFVTEATGVSYPICLAEMDRRGLPLRGQGVPGLKPQRDPETGNPIVDEEGNYVPLEKLGQQLYRAYLAKKESQYGLGDVDVSVSDLASESNQPTADTEG